MRKGEQLQQLFWADVSVFFGLKRKEVRFHAGLKKRKKKDFFCCLLKSSFFFFFLVGNVYFLSEPSCMWYCINVFFSACQSCSCCTICWVLTGFNCDCYRIANVMEISVVVWEFFRFSVNSSAKKKRCLTSGFHWHVKVWGWLKQLLTLLSEQQLNRAWPPFKISAQELHWSDASLCQIQTAGKLAPSNTSPSVFWYSGRQNGLSGLPLLPSLPVSHFCRMFLLSWVPIVHTLSWLASQGCCWLLGPLIGSSCALAFLAHLGLVLVSQTTQGISGEEFCSKKWLYMINSTKH